jgi:hypothetical protein
MSIRATFVRFAALGVMLLIPGALTLRAETAILEATADASAPGGAASAKAAVLQGPGTLMLGFKTWSIFKWNVISAELFLHVAKGPAPGALEIAVIPDPWTEGNPPEVSVKFKFVPHKASVEPQGWISIKVDAALVEEITAGKGHGLAVRMKSATAVNARESVAVKPYLIVNGGRA